MLASSNAVEETLGGAAPHLIDGLPDSCERRRQVLGRERIVEADDRDVLRDAKLVTPQNVQQCDFHLSR